MHLVLSAGGVLGFLDQGGGAVIDLRGELPLGLRAGARARVHLQQSTPITFAGDRLGALSSSVLDVAVIGGWCLLAPVGACILASVGGSREAVVASGDALFDETPHSKLTLSAALIGEAEYEPVERLVLRAGLGLQGAADPPVWSVKGIRTPVREAEAIEFVAHLTVGVRIF